MHSQLTPGEWQTYALPAGARVRIEALVGGQAVEVIAHAADDPRDRLSTLVTALAENVHEPAAGMTLWSQEYRPLLRVLEQTHSKHDLMLEACNPSLRSALGNRGDGSCWQNFREAVSALGLSEKWIPYPFGVFRQAGEEGGAFALLPASSRARDHLILEAMCDLTLVASACPLSAPDVGADVRTVDLEVTT